MISKRKGWNQEFIVERYITFDSESLKGVKSCTLCVRWFDCLLVWMKRYIVGFRVDVYIFDDN